MISTVSKNYYDAISELPDGETATFHDVSWEEYEELLEQVGEASGLRVSYNDGTLKVMSLSPEHEKYVRFIESMVSALRIRLRVNILFFGSMTMRRRKKSKGNEPDACFYVQSAVAIGARLDLDFAVDPPPDVVVEVDIHHDSTDNYSIYAALGVPEIWRYDGTEATILQLQESEYVEIEASRALPMITPAVLTEYLTRMKQDGEFEAIIAFDEWLQSIQR